MNSVISILIGSIIFLFAPTNPPQPIGTGFIIGYPHPEKKDKVFPLVVTAKHVIGDYNMVLGRFSLSDGKSPRFIPYNIQSLKASNDYWEHTDSGVDIAVFRTLNVSQTDYKPFPIDRIASKKTFQDEVIHASDRIIFPFLLTKFMGSSRNYPVLKDGSIALIPEEKVPLEYMVGNKRINTEQELIFVNAISVPGASGSPIFLWPGPRMNGQTYTIGAYTSYLLGIMYGFYYAEPSTAVSSGIVLSIAENSGVAITFPSWRLKEIIESDAVRNRINELVELEKQK